MKQLTTASGYALAESGNTLVLVDKQTRTQIFALLPLGIVTLNLGLAGLVFTGMTLAGAADFPVALSLGLLAAGALLGMVTAAVLRGYRKAAARPLADLKRVATWDFSTNEFRDGEGNLVGALNQIRVHKTVRLGSQGWWLVAKGGARDVVLVKGVNIHGGVGPFVQHFRARGLMD